MSKIKRPEKMHPSSGANGVATSVSTSPSIPTKKPPPILPPTSAMGNSTANGVSRTPARPRRDAPPQMLGRGQRTASAGLRSASLIPDIQTVQTAQPPPYIRSDSYILKKYRGCPASLIVHLHPTHFRFDQQDGTFSYKSPMKIFIEHLRSGTVPQDLLEYFNMWNTTFYEGCLIVEVHDHKSIATARESSQNLSSSDKTEPMSIHNSNAYLTPSPWVPYPKENLALTKPIAIPGAPAESEKGKTAEDKDKENMPAPGQPSDNQRSRSNAKKAKISTMVLHPTPMSTYVDLAIKATTPLANQSQGRRESHQDVNGMAPPQTPNMAGSSSGSVGMDPPPAKRQKREKMEIDSKNIYPVESSITLATTAPLFLEPVESAAASAALLEALAHPDHSFPVPSPKSRKKTVAEMAAEESAAADEEQYMLILDERFSNGAAGGVTAADGDSKVGGASFEPRFERFKAIESIKLQVVENKKREKLLQAEAAKKQQQESEAREKAKQEQTKRDNEESLRGQAQLRIQQQQQQQQQNLRQQENHRRQLAAQQAQNQQAMKGMQGAGPHGHPAPAMGLPNAANGMTTQQQRFLQQQQLSQAPTSSPIVQNATPHNASSPMTAGNIDVQMRHSTSSLGGSPPRPGSVVPQNPQMTPIVAHAMRAQGSQQSHGGTPRISQGTPNMSQEALRQTPRMSQTSPMPGHMVQVPQMGGGAHMMPNQNMMNTQMQQAQIIAQQQQQQQRLRQQAAQQAMNSSPMNGQQMSPQQMALQQQIAHQMQQGNPAMMGGNQMAINYNAQMRAMAAVQAQNSMQPNGQSFMGRGGAMTPQMIQQAQHQAALQAQQQQQQQQQQGQMQQGPPNIVQQRVQAMARQIYQSQITNFMAQYAGGQAPPEQLNLFKQQCQLSARQKIGQQVMIQQQQQQAMRQQQQQQQQGHMMSGQQHPGMVQGMNMGMNMGMQGNMNMNGSMNGNMNGSGMQRPSGM
ncbi:hypothetical protein V499_07693 [Pseudogymnoascus sp. VKM F-103]|uniref:Histone acetyltransferase SAGA complex member n=1 Tax=Pseudogymnoascus verrucosus TaxID=342668 RepID=A0A1B8GMW9_9PEZI|nr:histone acetyltransferase SAGA complex member [Pseudogymnoascus verrucosus]KFY72167.1 hypothetical protein V499_07693 [Pseudogymnoascus sp. VKM F-103]OBT97182.1 histone acetyltransferase SAGA complex member [Pseudogymnoascus verrucosus]